MWFCPAQRFSYQLSFEDRFYRRMGDSILGPQNLADILRSDVGLGIVVSAGLYSMGVPNAAMWGMFLAVLNFIPNFGPAVGVTSPTS